MPGFWEVFGRQSISLPIAMTGLPEPQRATQAVGMPATPRSIVKPFFSRISVMYFEVSNSWNAEFAEAEDLVVHHLRKLAPLLDAVDAPAS